MVSIACPGVFLRLPYVSSILHRWGLIGVDAFLVYSELFLMSHYISLYFIYCWLLVMSLSRHN